MMRRFKRTLTVILAVLMTTLSAWAAQPYTVELIHDGVPYQLLYTVEGVSDIEPTGVGLSSNGGSLEGHASPDGTITVTMEWVRCDGDESDLEWKRIDVWMGNRGTNGDAMRSDDDQQFTKSAFSYTNSMDRVTYTFPLRDFDKADPSVRDSTLLVTASSSLQVGSSVTEVTVYLTLHLDGASSPNMHYTEDNKASSKKGSDDIPAFENGFDKPSSEENGSDRYTIPLVIGGALAGGAAAATAASRHNRKKKMSAGKPDNTGGGSGDDESDDDDPDQLEMEIYKNFGDTLVVGDAAERVSACIIRHPKEGPEYVDEDLTQQIEISADDNYLNVEDGGMVNGWKSAFVSAPQPAEGESIPDEGIVKFRIANAEASYTNRLHFNIDQGQIVFGQDNLTMPAMYNDCMCLPFIVTGMEHDDMAGLPTVKITGKERGEESDYTVRVEWDAEKELYKIAIEDIWKDKEQMETYMPGDFLTYYIDVEATSKHGLVIKGRMPLHRFYMGLALTMDGNDVGCYLEEYDPEHHRFAKGYFTKQDGKEMTPCQTRVWLKAYDWDSDSNKLIVVNPAPKANDELHVVAQNENQQEMIDKLGLQLVAIELYNAPPYYLLCCRGGVLNAPNRINAKLEVKCMVDDHEQVFSRNVRLLSQPSRKSLTPAERAEADKRDNKMLDALDRIDKEITAQGLGDRLAPLVQYIQLQLDAFFDDHEKQFGFDERNVKAIMRTYHCVMEGEQGDANQNTLVACDNLQETVFEYFRSMRTTLKDMGTFQKIFYSVASFGLFDVAAGTIEVVGEMKDYVDKGGDSTFGMFCVGVKEVTKEYLTEKAMEFGMNKVKDLVKSSNIKNTWSKPKTEAKSIWTKEVSSSKEFGKRAQGAGDAVARNANAERKAKKLLTECRTRPSKSSSYTKEAVERGRKRAKENLEELQKAIDAVKKNPSEANILQRNSVVIKCQQDKQTMMMLKGQTNIETIAAVNDGVNFGECRKILNTHLDRVYRATDARVQARLAKLQPGLKPGDVKVLNATSSAKEKLLSGKSVTFDRDITYYYVDKTTGEVRYFSQRTTERIYSEEFQYVAKSGTEFSSGSWNVSKDAARDFAKSMDQTVVEDVLHHSESYGVDLERMIKQSAQGEKLANAEKVAEAVLYKGNERFYVAEKLMKAAEKSGDKLNLQADAIGEILEGCRQQVKVFDLLEARDIARMCVNGGSKISPQLRDCIAVLRPLAVDGSIDIKLAESALNGMGFTFKDVSAELYRTVINIG